MPRALWAIFIGLLCAGFGAFAQTQDPPNTQRQLDPEQERQLDIAQAEREVAVLPRVRMESVAQAVKFSLEDDFLCARTTVSPVDGEVRVITPNLPGIVRVRALDLGGLEEPSSGRSFSFVHDNITSTGSKRAITHVHATAGRLIVARDAESDAQRSSIQLIQDPPGTPVTPEQQPVRLLIRISDEFSVDQPAVDLTLMASSFIELRRKYPREVEMYFRPILRDLGQDSAIFAVDPRVAWQVLGEKYEPDVRTVEKVQQVLQQFDAEDFRAREAAGQQLRDLGVPAAIVLARMDRTNLSAEQNAGIDTFLAEYQQLKAEDVHRLGNSLEFLLDTLASEDTVLRRLALERLEQVTGKSIEFNPEGSDEARAAQLQKLRESLRPSTNRAG